MSAFTADSVTISGPPTTLRQLFGNFTSASPKYVKMPVYGPYHAPHLYNDINVDQFIRSADPKTFQILSTYRLALPLISTESGDCFDKDFTAPLLLAGVVKNILSQTFSLQDVVAGSIDSVNASHCQKCEIISLGPNESESMFAKALNSGTDAQVTLHINSPADILSEGLLNTSNTPRTSRKPKLAIVGMAGRFPNSADHEKFWDLLEAGLDVHRRVRTCNLLHQWKMKMLRLLRYPRTVSMSTPTLILPGKSAIQVIHLTGISLMSLVSSTHAFSTCHLVKPHRRTLCID